METCFRVIGFMCFPSSFLSGCCPGISYHFLSSVFLGVSSSTHPTRWHFVFVDSDGPTHLLSFLVSQCFLLRAFSRNLQMESFVRFLSPLDVVVFSLFLGYCRSPNLIWLSRLRILLFRLTCSPTETSRVFLRLVKGLASWPFSSFG